MTILKSKVVLTKKPHVCFGCNRKFDAGTSMQYDTIADGGCVYSTYLCPTCRKIIDGYIRNNSAEGEIAEGDLYYEAIEYENNL